MSDPSGAAPASGRGDGTRAVHAGLPPAAQGEPYLPGPTFAAPFHSAGDPHNAPFFYGRHHNPTWTRYEAALGEIEGGTTIAFASGMAAVTAILLPQLRPGDALVMPDDCYMSVRTIAEEHLAERGIEVRFVRSETEAIVSAAPDAKLVWVETPSNPGLDVVDLRRVIEAGHAAGALVAVDNTLATPFGQRALAHGADFSMSSDSKHMSGHSDLVLGHVACSDRALAEQVEHWRTHTGSIPGPFEAWLAHRSIATLDVRLERSCANALALAEFLAGRPDVSGVRYPGLPGDPAHALARRQMTRFGTVLGFDVGSEGRADALLEACELVAGATSFGGVHTSAERRARWGRDAVAPGFIRLSAGCEDAPDLIEDIGAALDRTSAA